jgi:hypothetical protein
MDAHNLSLGSIAQAAAVTRAEAAQLKITFVPHNSEPQIGDEGQIADYYSVTNTGKTIATDVKGTVRLVMVDRTKDETKEPDFRYVPHNSFDIGAMDSSDPESILNTAIMNRNGIEKFTRKNIEAVNKGEKKRLFMYGEVSYLDTFGVRHWSRKCEQLLHGYGVWRVPKCAAYNRADDNQVISPPKERPATESEKISPIDCVEPVK